MSCYSVQYDLFKSGQNYQCLTKKLETYGAYWHLQQSVWIIETDETAKEVVSKLSGCLDANDKLFVARLEGEAAWFGYNQKEVNWLIEVLD